MLFVYLTIPYLLSFLGKENYGIWVTLFSILNILFFVDAGIANGLKTKLSKAISEHDIELSKEYISTAYIAIFTISMSFLALGYFAISTISLTSLLNISAATNEAVIKEVFYILLIFVITNFVLSLYKTLFYATQKAAIIEISIFIYQFFVFVFIFYAANNLSSSLKFVAITYGSINILVGIIFSILFFFKNKKLLPKIKCFKKERLKGLMSLSINFFIIQLCMIVIFTSDNVLISNLLGPKEVADYDVVLKIFHALITISIISLEPFWAMFSDAYQKGDFEWIRATIRKLNLYFLVVVVLVLILILSAETIIKFWIGDSIQPEKILVYSMGVFVLVRLYGAVYMVFLNGIGKIKLQMWLYVFGAIINIPLSIYLVRHFNLGTAGIIIGTIISILANTLFLPMQSYKILKRD